MQFLAALFVVSGLGFVLGVLLNHPKTDEGRLVTYLMSCLVLLMMLGLILANMHNR